MKKIVYVMLLFFVICSFFGCAESVSEKAPSDKVTTGKATTEKAPDILLTDTDGKSFQLSDCEGKIIILNFFGTYCPPCRREMPDFNEIAQQYDATVEVIAINIVGESVQKVKTFKNQYDLSFRVCIDNGQAARAYGPIRAIPVTVIIDKEFNLAKRYVGAITANILRNNIESLSK